MKKTIPQQVVEVCDFCHRESMHLKECWVCGREFCLSDEGTVPGSMGFTQVCRDCDHKPRVQEICDKFAVRLRPILHARDEALKKLRTKVADVRG